MVILYLIEKSSWFVIFIRYIFSHFIASKTAYQDKLDYYQAIWETISPLSFPRCKCSFEIHSHQIWTLVKLTCCAFTLEELPAEEYIKLLAWWFGFGCNTLSDRLIPSFDLENGAKVCCWLDPGGGFPFWIYACAFLGEIIASPAIVELPPGWLFTWIGRFLFK